LKVSNSNSYKFSVSIVWFLFWVILSTIS
jgi:hypothetical protein